MSIQIPFNLTPKGGVAIDCNEDNIFRWSVSGAIQTHFSLEFRNNATDAVLHTIAKTPGYSHSYTLPSSTIANGLEIKYKLQVWDENNNTATSDWEIFQSSSRPTVTVTSPTEFSTVESQSYLFEASYSQTELVDLSTWQFFLYDSSQIKIVQSDLQTEETLEYLYDGLQSNETYFIEFQATSEKGLTGTSGLIEFTTQFIQPQMLSELQAENVDNAGIKLQWQVIQIIGNGENHSFIEDEKVDVTEGKVWFDQGFNIDNNFTLKVWLEAVQDTTFIINPMSSIIISDTAPANNDVIWLYDSSISTPQELTVVMSDTSPVGGNYLWLENPEVASSQTLGVLIDIHKPENINVLWFDLMANMDKIRLIKLRNNKDELIELVVYNEEFRLLKNGKLIDSLDIYVNDSTKYYIYIQQIEDSLVLGGEVII